MEQGLLEWGQEPEADGGTARQALVHQLHTGTPVRFCAEPAEAESPGEAAEAGYMAAGAADGIAEPSPLQRSNSTMNRTLLKQLNF
jgi:hypothetical protein